MLDCDKPNKGEQLVKDYLEYQGYTVEDVSKNPKYWSKDIDIIATKGDEQIKIEVKYDKRIHKTNNLFIETLSDVDYNKCGWFDDCEADELFYIDAVNGTCFVIPLDDLRDYIKNHDCSIGECNDNYKRSRGLLVNVWVITILYDLEIIDLGAWSEGLKQKRTI